MSVASIVGKVRRLQKIKADRLAPSRARRLRPTEQDKSAALEARRRAREEAAASGTTAPLFPEYFNDPVGFAVLVLGLRLCRAQRRILVAIARGRRVAIRSGQKTGKSTAFVAAALWWAATRPRARVLFTGPGNAQVKDVLWKELHRIVYDTKNLRADGKTVAEVLGVEPAIMPHTGMQWPDGREIVGFVRESPTATQGFSGPEVLIIIDEASGVPDAIFEAHEGNTAAEGRILAASNPTCNVGWFFEAFHTQLEFWDTIHLSSEDTPNITGEEEAIPGLAGPDWLKLQLEKYGRKNPAFIVRVLGDFAGTTSNTIVGLALLTKSHERRAQRLKDEVEKGESPNLAPLEYGVDVARFGDDDTTMAPRRGKRVYPLIVEHGLDGNGIAGVLLKDIRARRLPGEIPVVKIDGTGGWGTSPADILRAGHSHEVTVIEVNSSCKADDEELYTNTRSQMHFGVAQWLEDGGELPEDKKLDVELLAPTYSFDARRRYVVEPKAAIKKRIQRSPDRADAVALSIYKAELNDVPYEDEHDPATRGMSRFAHAGTDDLAPDDEDTTSLRV